MHEIVWTRRAEDHVQRVFSELDDYSSRIAGLWLEEIERRVALLARFPEMASVWRGRFRCLKLRRGLGLFYVVEGRRLVVAGIFPLTMDPATLVRRWRMTTGSDQQAGQLRMSCNTCPCTSVKRTSRPL